MLAKRKEELRLERDAKAQAEAKAIEAEDFIAEAEAKAIEAEDFLAELAQAEAIANAKAESVRTLSAEAQDRTKAKADEWRKEYDEAQAELAVKRERTIELEMGEADFLAELKAM